MAARGFVSGNYPRRVRTPIPPQPDARRARAGGVKPGKERFTANAFTASHLSDRDLVILVPLLGRPHRVQPVFESMRDATPRAHVLFLVSHDDPDAKGAVGELLHRYPFEVDAMLADWPGGSPGDYARKMNMGVARTSEAMIFLGADDLHYHDGWLKAALAQLRPGIGVIGTNDLGNPRVISGDHATHSLVLRSYVEQLGTIDQPGKLLHEGYVHEFCDDELVGTARYRHAYAHAGDSHVEHLHPHWNKAPTDASYDAQDDRIAASRAHFEQRRRLWGAR